jgi:hypothetical protein
MHLFPRYSGLSLGRLREKENINITSNTVRVERLLNRTESNKNTGSSIEVNTSVGIVMRVILCWRGKRMVGRSAAQN